jgi:very-short-patch-repair endonuclease
MADHAGLSKQAANQHGLVSRRQMCDHGFTRSGVAHAVRCGRLEWLSPRVLRVVGAPDTLHQRAMAAVLDAGDAAVALGSALALRGVPGWRLEPVHVLTTRRPHRGSPHLGIVHSTLRFDPEQVTLVDGIPATTPARTLVDLALRISGPKLEDTCDDLLRRRFMPLASLHAVAADLPVTGGPAGWALLRRLAAARPEGYQPTGSKLERRFEEILEAAGLAPFDRQVDIGDDQGWIGRVDFADRRLKVIVEVQSDTFHSSISDRRRDAERLARLCAAGWIVVEVHEREIWSSPAAVVAKVQAARARATRRAA